MSVYRRYLMREVAAAILLVFAGFLALFGFFDMLGEIRNVGEGGYQFRHALMFVILRLPGRIYELMPARCIHFPHWRAIRKSPYSVLRECPPRGCWPYFFRWRCSLDC